MGLAARFVLAAVLAAPDPLSDAEKLLQKRDYRGAEAVLREILKTEPSNARVHGNLALALLEQKKLREAVDEGRLAAAFGPETPQARFIYGLTLKAAGRPIEATREFEKTLALEPGAVAPLRALAETYAETGDERATDAYSRLIAREPGVAADRAALAAIYWASGKAADGNRTMEEAVARFPENRTLRIRYGRALFEQERFADAARELARARELGASDAATLGLWANALWSSGDTAAAAQAFEAAIGTAPPEAALHRDAGRLALSLGDGAGALARLSEAARLSPSDAAIQLDLGRAYEAVGKNAEAESAYRRAALLAPNLASPLYALGTLLVRTGRREEGRRELEAYRGMYERARQVSEQQNARGAELALAWAELNRGNARAGLERFAALPETPDSLLGRAAALSRLKRHAEAVRVLERARVLAPEDDRIRTQLALEKSREVSS
jgi:Flp pilus assembly protein TadD